MQMDTSVLAWHLGYRLESTRIQSWSPTLRNMWPVAWSPLLSGDDHGTLQTWSTARMRLGCVLALLALITVVPLTSPDTSTLLPSQVPCLSLKALYYPLSLQYPLPLLGLSLSSYSCSGQLGLVLTARRAPTD